MKRLLLLTIFLIVSVISAQNVDVRDYKVPISKATTFRANGFWNWSQVGDSVSGNTANATVLFRKFYTSLPFAWFINVDATGGRDAGKKNYDVKFDGSIRKYIWDREDWFGFSRIRAERANNYDRISSDFTIGAGYGRYINATALAKAVRIEEHLLKEKIISDFLPKEIMINIANIIERQQEYINLYGPEVYETQWFNDIEKQIASSNVLKTPGIGSIGILRMRQVLFGINERVNERYYGWDLSAGALFPITTRDTSKAGSPNLALTGRYSFPFNWSTQMNIVAEVSTPIDTVFAKQVLANTGVDFIYELSNRINLLAGYRLGIYKPATASAYIDNLVNVSFLYYIENNIYFGINAAYEKLARSPKRLSTSITLSYNLY
ncbi:MAG: hypothetical protein Q8933_10635 [Bacteroidota bacterium]|nr:hypothetical protein [Bacteroidota bacterium]MDP4190264.1 hypothetical protein [Bacteroidota bacterium]MDP4194265.1 hypothetical protein [Bacteroidota bacterium]